MAPFHKFRTGILIMSTRNSNVSDAKLHWLLTVQTVVIIALTVNRLSSLTLSFVAANEFLRWVDLLNMLLFPLASLAAFQLLKDHLAYPSPARESARHRLLNLLFLLGVYVTGASYGLHEVTNYLNIRFCIPEIVAPDLCQIIAYNDDEFSHYLFFAGFVITNVVVLFINVLFPVRQALTRFDGALLVANGLFIALGIFANLAFEEIGYDLYVVLVLGVLSLWLFRRYGRQPLIVYYATAYGVGWVATALAKALLR
jgi:hypothetical protein